MRLWSLSLPVVLALSLALACAKSSKSGDKCDSGACDGDVAPEAVDSGRSESFADRRGVDAGARRDAINADDTSPAADGAGNGTTDAGAAEADGDIYEEYDGGHERPVRDSCPVGLALCGDFCMDVNANVKNCGSCGNVCPADSTCTDGICEDVCNPVEVSSKDDLVSRLTDLDWVSSDGVKRYLSATVELEIRASELGDAYVFISDVPDIVVSEPVDYGLVEDGSQDSNCEEFYYPRYPSTAYGQIIIPAGTVFTPSLVRYDSEDASRVCPEGQHCLVFSMQTETVCCCANEPFEWNVLRLRQPAELCPSSDALCVTQFAGKSHSSCYSGYHDYVVQEGLEVHLQCIADNGYPFNDGRSCTCECSLADIAYRAEGECGENGLCRVSASSNCSSRTYDCLVPSS